MSNKQIIQVTPTIIKIPKTTQHISFDDQLLNLSSNIDYPRSDFGFHHFFHANKNKLEILKKFEGKKKVYKVLNKFNPTIDNYDDTIANKSVTYLNINPKIGILNRSFYKLWELFSIFGIVDKSNKFTSFHLNDTTGSFLQATMLYRETMAKKNSKNDKYFVTQDIKKNINSDFINEYQKEKPVRITVKNTSEVTECDIVTADITLTGNNINVYEQQSYVTILNQIITATKLLKKGGCFICKFYETYTLTSAKIICLLNELFDNVYFSKPLMSEMKNSEKYAVCIGFMKKDKKIEDNIKKLHNDINNIKENNNIVDLFTSYIIPNEIINTITYLNCSIANLQLKNINEVVSFVKKEIYFGDEYHEKRDEQIEGTKYWIDTYYSGKEYPDIVKNNTNYANEQSHNLETNIVDINIIQHL